MGLLVTSASPAGEVQLQSDKSNNIIVKDGDTRPSDGSGIVEESTDPSDEKEGDPDVDDDSEGEDIADSQEPSKFIPVFTSDLGDEEIARRWNDNPESLGSISMGVANSGRLLNGGQFPEGNHWVLMSPAGAWGTKETIEYTINAISAVNALFSETPEIAIGDLSKPKGGYFRGHKSHQYGRDVDLGFFYSDEKFHRHFETGSASNLDLPRNWALVRALIVSTDVQMILIDKRVIKVLYEYAESIGEDKEWLDAAFKAGRASIVKHARRHRGHYHVRYFNPRAQELARRIVPYVGKGRTEDTAGVVAHRIRNGDCLGALARRYNTSINAIKKANGMGSNALRAGRTLMIPAKGAVAFSRVMSTPEMSIPERRLPPSTPEMYARAAGIDPAVVRPASTTRVASERYIGTGGMFPPFRTFTIPMAY
ncbi:MAG: penicillin-insensitive murein endopeptidase [Myxococcota bacterium]